MPDQNSPVQNFDFIQRTLAASEITKQFLHESDRGSILIGGAMLDEIMRAMLQAYFRGDKQVVGRLLDGGSAPLGTFSSRIALCRALNIIPQELYHDLDLVRKLRNEAAHFEWSRKDGFDISFENEAVQSRMRAFQCVHLGAWDGGLTPRQVFVAFIHGVSVRFSELSLAGLFIRENLDHEIGDDFGVNVARKMLAELGARAFRPVVSRSIHSIYGVYLEPPPEPYVPR